MVFSLGDVINICSAIITIGGATTIFIKLYRAAKAPEKKLAERLEKVEKKLEIYEEYFARDKVRFAELEEGNRITQKGMLALLKHAKNGEDISSVDRAEKDLEEYLINKKLRGLKND